jgi:hypothetical protein
MNGVRRRRWELGAERIRDTEFAPGRVAVRGAAADAAGVERAGR